MRTVQASVSAYANGLDPQLVNPDDPWQRPMNYPSIWTWIASKLNLTSEVNYLGFVSTIAGLFLLCCYSLLRKYPSIPVLVACLSGSTLLAVERGNNDLVVFILLYLAVVAPVALRVPALLMATLLKIYPILAAPAFFSNKRSVFGLLLGSLIIFLILLPELQSIRAATPVSWMLSYGSQSLSGVMDVILDISPPSLIISFVLLGLAAGLTLLRPYRDFISKIAITDEEQTLFVLGGCIYVGTFILASNFDYRLIFLLFCLPMLIKIKLKVVRRIMLAVVILAMNQTLALALLGKVGFGLNLLAKMALVPFIFSILLVQFRAIFCKPVSLWWPN